MPEAVSFESRCHSRLFQQSVVAFLGFCRRYVVYGPQQPAIVEPVDPSQCRKLDGFKATPRAAPMNDLCLVEAVDPLGECIFIAVADAADLGLDAGCPPSAKGIAARMAKAGLKFCNPGIGVTAGL